MYKGANFDEEAISTSPVFANRIFQAMWVAQYPTFNIEHFVYRDSFFCSHQGNIDI